MYLYSHKEYWKVGDLWKKWYFWLVLSLAHAYSSWHCTATKTPDTERWEGARLSVGFIPLGFGNVVVDCGLWWREPDTSRQLRHPTLFVWRDLAQPASQPQPVTGRISANKLAFMWWRRQCKKFIIVRETSCVSVELLTFDNYSLKMRQNSACLK